MKEEEREIRITARVLLFDNAQRLLLMQIKEHDQRISWITIGGKVEEKETLLEAAQRELFEETGISSDLVRIGQVPVWYGEHLVNWQGRQTTLLKESFFVAKIANDHQVTLSKAYLTAEEQDSLQGFKWWSLEELQKASADIIVYPPKLPIYLEELLSRDGARLVKEFLLNKKELQPRIVDL